MIPVLRLYSLPSAPPYAEGSLDEITYSMDTLGAVGVKFPTNANGVYPGDPSLIPLWKSSTEYARVPDDYPPEPGAPGSERCYYG